MAEQKKIAGVPMGLVKGGTTSSAWDQRVAKHHAQSDRLRSHYDWQRDQIARAANSPNERAAMMSLNMLSTESPKVVLTYKYRDSALDRECICQLAMAPNPDDPGTQGMILVLVCPKCLERHGRQDDAQLQIKDWHRQFWLDDTKKSVYVNPHDGSVHQIAGTITSADAMTCSALGCTWRFRIDNSKLYEV